MDVENICEDVQGCDLKGGVALAEEVHEKCQVLLSERPVKQGAETQA